MMDFQRHFHYPESLKLGVVAEFLPLFCIHLTLLGSLPTYSRLPAIPSDSCMIWNFHLPLGLWCLYQLFPVCVLLKIRIH